MTFRDSVKVVGTLRVPSATLVTAHRVCLLLDVPHDCEMSFRFLARPGVHPRQFCEAFAERVTRVAEFALW